MRSISEHKKEVMSKLRKEVNRHPTLGKRLARGSRGVDERAEEIEWTRKRINPLAFVSFSKFSQLENKGKEEGSCMRCDNSSAACLGLLDGDTQLTVYCKIEDSLGVSLKQFLERNEACPENVVS